MDFKEYLLKEEDNKGNDEKKDKKEDKKVDLDKIIKALIDTPASDSNDDQGKFVQLLRGIAFSDDPKSDIFMKKLMKMTDKSFQV